MPRKLINSLSRVVAFVNSHRQTVFRFPTLNVGSKVFNFCWILAPIFLTGYPQLGIFDRLINYENVLEYQKHHSQRGFILNEYLTKKLTRLILRVLSVIIEYDRTRKYSYFLCDIFVHAIYIFAKRSVFNHSLHVTCCNVPLNFLPNNCLTH